MMFDVFPCIGSSPSRDAGIFAEHRDTAIVRAVQPHFGSPPKRPETRMPTFVAVLPFCTGKNQTTLLGPKRRDTQYKPQTRNITKSAVFHPPGFQRAPFPSNSLAEAVRSMAKAAKLQAELTKGNTELLKLVSQLSQMRKAGSGKWDGQFGKTLLVVFNCVFTLTRRHTSQEGSKSGCLGSPGRSLSFVESGDQSAVTTAWP